MNSVALGMRARNGGSSGAHREIANNQHGTACAVTREGWS